MEYEYKHDYSYLDKHAKRERFENRIDLIMPLVVVALFCTFIFLF